MMDRYIVTMPNGDQWGVPVDVIADNRAGVYMHEFGDDRERSLNEDTLPLFKDDHEIHDWAANNMNWDDIEPYAVLVTPYIPPAADFQEGWINGNWKVNRS